ncbi:MAG TPA: hypothetical protein VFV94_16375 [Polyangiaceae bacterium]|nr:hypothetical protein [Polyangiaceae bacterium]
MSDPRDEELDDAPLLEPATEAALAEALRSAYAPGELDPARHRAILDAALDDPFAPASDEELRESERLRQALETGDDEHADAVLARALRAATNPEALPPERTREAAARALPRKPNVVFVAFGAAALAAAAALALLIARPPAAKTSPPVALARSRSTAELFSERFEPGQASARIDRIASSREREWRDNQYALWGLK